MIAHEALVTFDTVEGCRVLGELGYVSGQAQQQQDPWRATWRTLSALVGLGPSQLMSDLDRLRSDALDALCAQAEALGADAVIGVQFHAGYSDDGTCALVAFGQAVRLDHREGATG
ncbi:MAG: heavy metal-binding domain-containing protein [Vulcanimicrobiaceae bacterium]